VAVNSISTFISEASRPVVRAVVDSRRIAHFLKLMYRISTWPERQLKKIAAFAAAADYEAGDEHFGQDQFNRIYAARLGAERNIDIHAGIRRLTINR
jgi:hypothetical protein